MAHPYPVVVFAYLLLLLECSLAKSKYSFFDQTLDHFNPQNNATYRQRFYVQTDYCTESPSRCPIFLYICGEYTCEGIPDDYIQVLAQRLQAVIVMPEHRYYGQSMPFEELTVENLRFLSSKQAICDLASFRDYFQKMYNKQHGLSDGSENPWITFGVSYPGALSAWFRLKFPHLTRGSISSSGVVHAILAYTQFDEQVAASVGANCAICLRRITMSIEASLTTNNTATKELFGAGGMSDGDFLYYVADVAATSVQYGHQYELCNQTIRAVQTGQDPTIVFANYCKGTYNNIFGSYPMSYSQDVLKKVVPGNYTGGRQWWYQKCTEVGFFQIAPQHASIRSQKINLDYHRQLCSNVFSLGLWPDVNETNLYYGGKDIAGTNIVFMNGSQDPWQHASKLVSSLGEHSIMISCANCGHGVDMRGCPQHPAQTRGNASNCADSAAVYEAREEILATIQSWIRA